MKALFTTAVFLLMALSVTALRVGGGAGTSVNWATQGKVSAPKYQALCNASYAFALAGNIESTWAIAGHDLKNLSTQEIISCAHHGCTDSASAVADAMTWLLNSNNGKLDTSDSYPFTSYHGNVPLCNTQTGIVGASFGTTKTFSGASETTIASYVQQTGPVIALIDDAGLDGGYTSGVWSGCPATPSANHAVEVVGYDDSASAPYWILKNSRGSSWGVGGYFMIPMGTNACGITTSVSTVVAGTATLPPTPVPQETRTPSPPIAPPTPLPPSPPVPSNSPDHHWTDSPGSHHTSSPSSQRLTAYVCSDQHCSSCQEKKFYQGECAWENGWSFKAWCDGSSAGSQSVNLNVYSEAKCGGHYAKVPSFSDYCFGVNATGGIPAGEHIKIKCPYN